MYYTVIIDIIFDYFIYAKKYFIYFFYLIFPFLKKKYILYFIDW